MTDIKGLKERCKQFLDVSGVPITKLCARLDMATSTYYRWQRGTLDLSQARLTAIDSYLSQFGY